MTSTTPITRKVFGIRDSAATHNKSAPKIMRTAATTYSAVGLSNGLAKFRNVAGASTPTAPNAAIITAMTIAVIVSGFTLSLGA